MTIMDESRFSRLLIPVKKVIFRKGCFRWPTCPILAGSCIADILPLRQLSCDLSKHSLKTSVTKDVSGTAALRIYRDKDIDDYDAYRINIAQNGIKVYAGGDAGVYYAVQTLRDIVTIYGRVLPVCVVEDKPDFRRRGVYLDCSRGKVPTLDTLKVLVERLSHWKINEIQLYVEDVFAFKRHRQIGKGGSPLTPEEILSLQEHCRKHHVRLVGSLASFGHLEKILALPRYSHLGEKPGFRGFPGGTTLCPIDSASIRLITELYSEFVPLFEAKDFNICCDETWELGKGRSRKKALVVGEGQIYLDFILKIHHLCEKHGKHTNAWGDVALKYPKLLGRLPRDIVLLNWEYEQEGVNIDRTKEIADAGLPLMVCPGTSSWLTHGTRLPNSMSNVANFAAQGRKYRAQGLLNTDWGDEGHRNLLGVSLHSFAHGAACAWGGEAVDNAKFTENFCLHVFGQRNNRMAEAIRLLGNSYITCGRTVPNKSLLHQSLFEPVLQIETMTQSPIDMMKKSGLLQIEKEFSDDNLWPESLESAEGFEQLALKELKLATKMDCLAAGRALIVKALRAGQKAKSSELLKLSRQMSDVAKEFEKLWLSRNKLSRLYDNLRLFHRAREELFRLAGKC